MELPANDPWFSEFDNPVDRALLEGRAQSVAEAEELVLSESWEAALEFLGSPLSNEELAATSSVRSLPHPRQRP